ncbi:biotin/lipoyl-containing protein [Agrilactobacillus yilanensis]|uniref:Biotin/lipoyl-containing protein n=1 Tax=Agrilactobacillus yilanensis TaxID=2485997 RepID=A0ABW4J6S9_9LACO|nr:biotin/lipoyl-containing protein [Agrilactobacillus yilanensis]
MLRKFKIKIDGNEYAVEMEELTPTPVAPVQAAPAAPTPEPAPQPAAAPTTGEGTAVDAPMPGNIIDIKVKVGDAVTEGQTLLILEAMKMENEIVAPKAGTITGINTIKGDVVSTGDILLTIQ